MAKDTLNRLTRSKDDSSNTEQEKKLLDTVRKGQKGWQKVRGNLTNIRNMSDKKIRGVVNEVKGVVVQMRTALAENENMKEVQEKSQGPKNKFTG